MREKLGSIIIAAIVGVAMSTGAAQSATKSKTPASGALDGKTVSGTLIEEGEKKGMKDNLIFKEGTFDSSACRSYGFKPVAYTTESNAGRTAFHAVAKNRKGETMDWTGTMEGARTEATAVYTNKKGKRTKYVFNQGS